MRGYVAGTVFLYQAIGFRATQLINGVFFTMAFVTVLWVTNPIYFMVLYSLGVGVGSGAAIFICALESWKHFSAKSKGKVLGIITASYGLGPAVFNPLFSFLCNPNNEVPTIDVIVGETKYSLFEGEVADSVPRVSAAMGVLFAISFLIAVVFFPSKAKETDPGLSVPIAATANTPPQFPDLKTALSSWIFWSLALNMLCGMTYGLYILNAYKNYGMTRYQNDQLLSTVGGFAAGISTVGKAVFSMAMDHLSFKVVYGFNIILQLIVSLTITYVLETSLLLYSVWVTASFLVMASVFPAFIMETTHVFGNT